ncbi:MAG: hypothetical protein ACI84E_002622 [Planctomycetota bacterium]|jgi:hypothetical protein
MKFQLWIPVSLMLLALPSAAERVLPNPTSATVTKSVDNPEERCKALAKEASDEHRAFIKQYRADVKAAKDAGDDPPAFSFSDSPLVDFIGEFQSAAEDYKGTDGAIPFLMWILDNGARIDTDAAKAAVETLCVAHVTSEALAPLADSFGNISNLVGAERATELFKIIETKSPVPSLVGWAVYNRIEKVLAELDVKSDEYAKARFELMSAIDKADDDRMRSEIANKLRVREVFSLGMVAPDIEGIDLDGAAFKLSDYKGKIVFLDFWGDW